MTRLSITTFRFDLPATRISLVRPTQVGSQRPSDSFDSPNVWTVAVLDLDGDGVLLKRFHISFDEGEDLVETLFVPWHSLAKETFKIDERELYAWRL